MNFINKLTSKSNRWWIVRILSGVVGLILLISGLIKAGDMELFIRQIRDYGIISHHLLLILTAWCLIIAECTIGTALLIFFRPRITIPITSFLLAIFIGVTGYAWVSGVTEDCGCFGAWVKRSPEGAMIEDLLMLAALIPPWIWAKDPDKVANRLKSIILIIVCVAATILPIAFGLPISRISGLEPGGTYLDEDLLNNLSLEQVELKRGRHLIVIMSTDCEHCRESVGDLNRITNEEDLPDLIALTPNEPEQIAEFTELFEPEFPMFGITEDNFWELLGDGDVPRIMLVNDRRVLNIWDVTVPDIEEIREAVN